MTYEYNIEQVSFRNHVELLKILNDLGKEGWIVNSINTTNVIGDIVRFTTADITCMREANYDRVVAMKWWNNMKLRDKFHMVTKYNYLIVDEDIRHPDTLTDSEIELIFKEYHIELNVNV